MFGDMTAANSDGTGTDGTSSSVASSEGPGIGGPGSGEGEPSVGHTNSRLTFVIKSLFKILKTVIANHQFVCTEFQRKFQEQPLELLPAISQTGV